MELETVHLVSLLGFLAALVFGAVANRTHFCIMGAISDWVNMGSMQRFRTWLLALGIAILATQVMYLTGVFDIHDTIYLTPTFGWLGYILGGMIFGIGMTLGAGCGQRTLVRVGGGNLKSLFVLLVLGITAYMTLRGLLAPVRINAVDAAALDFTSSGFANQGMPHLLATLTGIGEGAMRIAITVILCAGVFWYVFKDRAFRVGFDNILAGVTVGIVCASAWYITGVVGNDDFDPVPVEGFSFIAPVGNSINYLMTYTGSTIGFGIAIVGGMIAGSFLYAILSGTFRIETFTNRGDMINHLIGGVMMGFGGVLSLGCTIGQGVTGFSTLALGSVFTITSIFFGCALTLKIQYYMIDDGFWRSLHLALADLRMMPTAKQA
jgi:uncharacterized protein